MHTKVFGIGFPRTGTTSLHALFQMFGLSAKHCDIVLCNALARGEWDIHSIAAFDAFSDSPIPLIWRDIYYLYPDSRFVMTIRPKDVWLRSILNLYNFNCQKNHWSLQPENYDHREYLTMLFGSPDFDPDIWLSSYVRHIKMVRAFFALKNPDQYLELDVREENNKNNAQSLAKFIGAVAHASVEMPVRNKHGVDGIGLFV
jgi:hypothetical protein